MGGDESGIERGVVRQLAKAEWSPMAAVKHGDNCPASRQLTQAAGLVAGVGKLEIRDRRAQLRNRMIGIGHQEMIPSMRCAATH